MEPPSGIWASLWDFICFLPYFIGLLILGFIKGLQLLYYYSIYEGVQLLSYIFGRYYFLPIDMPDYDHSKFRYHIGSLAFALFLDKLFNIKQFGPVLKIVLCLCISFAIILWPIIGIIGSVIGGATFGFLAPMFGTLKGVEEGKTNFLFHCVYDGTVDTLKESFNFITDFKDVSYHSYFSVTTDLRRPGPEEGKYFEIRLLDIPGAIVAGVLGMVVDFPVIFLIAICKSPYMLVKGWHRVLNDCIGREGPFLESICVPFSFLAIILWPLAVAVAVLGSVVSSPFLGAYAAVVVYQESSLWFGLRYIVASLSIYDEYSNDVLDMPEGSYFPRPRYRKKDVALESASCATSFSRPDSFRNPSSRAVSFNGPMVELKPLELLNGLLKMCQENGEILVREGSITLKDIEDAKSSKDMGKVISIGLPAYSFLQMLLRSAKSNSTGILLSDGVTEITSSNLPKYVFFDWFLNPLVVIKDQIKAENLTEAEEDYLCKVVLLSGDTERLKSLNVISPTGSEIRRVELDAFARRLRGITKSISRYPSFKRRFDDKIKAISEDLARKNGNNKPANGQQSFSRSKSAFVRMFSQKSFKNKTDNGSNRGSQHGIERDVDIV